MVFQLKSKNVLLTYAQCTVTKDATINHLKNLLLPDHPNIYIIVGHELHQDGGDHLHAYLRSESPIRTRDNAYFDIEGFHPNIVSCRSPQKARDYAKKDNDYIEHGNPDFIKRKWSDIEDAVDKDEALDIIKEVSYRDYVLQHDKIDSFLQKKYRHVQAPYQPRSLADFDTTRFPDLAAFIAQMDEVSSYSSKDYHRTVRFADCSERRPAYADLCIYVCQGRWGFNLIHC
jgi:hypothetical protein